MQTETKTNSKQTIHVIVDVFRAFSTACVILEKKPKRYILTNKCDTIVQIISKTEKNILVGKPGIGSKLKYDVPNSPSLVEKLTIHRSYVYHRTAAGATGVIQSNKDDITLCMSFNNIDATANYIKTFNSVDLHIKPMGHEANNPTIEDNLCADMLKNRIYTNCLNSSLPIEYIKKTTGMYFFTDDKEYPQEDFSRCLEINSHMFAIKAEIKEGYALLRAVDPCIE